MPGATCSPPLQTAAHGRTGQFTPLPNCQTKPPAHSSVIATALGSMSGCGVADQQSLGVKVGPNIGSMQG
jgi:hypothetical protein